MSIGNNQKPYRAACGLRACPTGPAYRHAIQRVIADKYVNHSSYTVTHTTCDPWQMDPPTSLNYNADECGAVECGGDCGVCAEDGTPEYKLADGVVSVDLNALEGATEQADNNYLQDGTIDLTPCRALGFKSVQATKVWHGRYGFTTAKANGLNCDSETTYCDTRYRTVSRSASATFSGDSIWYYPDSNNWCGDSQGDQQEGVEGLTWLYAGNAAYTVNKDSGIITQTSQSNSPSISRGAYFTTRVNYYPGYATNYWEWIPGVTPGDKYYPSGVVFNEDGSMTMPPAPNVTYSCNGGGTVGTVYGGRGTEWSQAILAFAQDVTDVIKNIDAVCGQPFYFDGETTHYFEDAAAFEGYITSLLSITSVEGREVTVTLETTDANGDPGSWTLEDDLFAGGFTMSVSVIEGTQGVGTWQESTYTSTFSFEVALDDTYTAANVYSDAVGCAEDYPMDDDALYPWRTDSYCYIAPLMRPNEANAPVNPDIKSFEPFTDSGTYDGAVVGPLPAGYQGVFDPMHDNFRHTLCDLGGGSFSPATGKYSRGALTPSYLPQNAPRWTNEADLDNGDIWPCNYVSMTLWGCKLQKFAEVMIRRPSINFGRPYGADRFALDEEHVYQLDSFVGSVMTLLNYDKTTPTSLPFVAGDVIGGDSTDGFWNVVSTSGNAVTVDTKVYEVPAGWLSASSFQDGVDDTSLIVGKLRWSTAPPFGGLLAVTATYSAGTGLTTITADAPYMVTGDKVDIYGFGLAALGSNVTLTRTGANTFTASGDYSQSKTIVPHGTTWYFANDTSKGDFVWRQWYLSVPSMSVASSSSGANCLPFLTCQPQVLYGTPNTEEFDNSYKVSFPESISVNSAWVFQFEQHMVDPFYQTPHIPCGVIDSIATADVLNWSSDDGTCIADTSSSFGESSTRYDKRYAFPPLVESRLTVAGGYGANSNETAPALASGATPLNPTVSPPSNAQYVSYGSVPEAIISYTTPWGIYLRENSCVNANGRFSNEYQANLAGL